MSIVKRKRDEVADGEQNSSSKHVRLNALEPASISLVQPRKKIQLMDLPDEILLHIIRVANEPALAHTCKFFHDNCPDFIQHTKALVGIAYASHDDNSPDADSNIYCPLLKCVAPSDRPHLWTIEERLEIQRYVAGCAWLKPIHLRKTLLQCFQATLSYHVLENDFFFLNRSQRALLKHLYDIEDCDGLDIDQAIRTRLQTSPCVWETKPVGQTWKGGIFDDRLGPLGAAGLEEVDLTLESNHLGWENEVGPWSYEMLNVHFLPSCLCDPDLEKQFHWLRKVFADALQ